MKIQFWMLGMAVGSPFLITCLSVLLVLAIATLVSYQMWAYWKRRGREVLAIPARVVLAQRAMEAACAQLTSSVSQAFSIQERTLCFGSNEGRRQTILCAATAKMRRSDAVYRVEVRAQISVWGSDDTCESRLVDVTLWVNTDLIDVGMLRDTYLYNARSGNTERSNHPMADLPPETMAFTGEKT